MKAQILETIVETIKVNGNPAESSNAIDKVVASLVDSGFLKDSPTDHRSSDVDYQAYWLINNDIIFYGKSSSIEIAAQRIYNLLEQANLIVGLRSIDG